MEKLLLFLGRFSMLRVIFWAFLMIYFEKEFGEFKYFLIVYNFYVLFAIYAHTNLMIGLRNVSFEFLTLNRVYYFSSSQSTSRDLVCFLLEALVSAIFNSILFAGIFKKATQSTSIFSYYNFACVSQAVMLFINIFTIVLSSMTFKKFTSTGKNPEVTDFFFVPRSSITNFY